MRRLRPADAGLHRNGGGTPSRKLGLAPELPAAVRLRAYFGKQTARKQHSDALHGHGVGFEAVRSFNA